MSSPLISIAPEASVEKACELMAKNDIRRMSVMENDELVGIISVRNILTRAPEHVKKFYPGNENTFFLKKEPVLKPFCKQKPLLKLSL